MNMVLQSNVVLQEEYTMSRCIQTLKLSLLGLSLTTVAANAQNNPHFIIKVKTDNPGTSASNEFTIPVKSFYDYNYSVDCNNDGTFEHTDINESFTCQYPSRRDAQNIAIKGTFPAIYFNNDGDKEKLLEIVNWGNIEWKSMSYAFKGAVHLTVTATDNPDLSNVHYMDDMFSGDTNLTFTNPIDDWNTSSVYNMNRMFHGAEKFNKPIGNWDISNVTGMQDMFYNAKSFNQPIGNWDVSNVVYFDNLFNGATAFNQDIGRWDTSSGEQMWSMFQYATSFNQDIGDWDVSKVKDMRDMFYKATAFNQDIGDWDVSGITSSAGLQNVLRATPLFISNYDSLLQRWSEIDTLVDDVAFNVGTAEYCEGEDGKELIIDNHHWTFTDGGAQCNHFHLTSYDTVTVENGTTTVMTVTTTYPDPDDNIFEIKPVADGDKFTIDANGVLSFITPPDGNHPTDLNGDGIYRVQVYACDASMCLDEDYQTVRVKVLPNPVTANPALLMYMLD